MANTTTNHPLVKWMKELDIPITRENFIECNWVGDPPDPWTVEAEDQIPEELQDWSWLNQDKEDDDDEM